ncbi:MAG: NADH-quinone oxidoreductase subunit L [Thermoplasmata archaeon]|nr:NADH-quinone oxidoreductase subunit L [Thermoplasmata archaeon]
MNPTELAYLLVIIPFIGFLIVAFFGNKMKEGGAYLAIASVASTLVLSILILFDVMENGSYEVSMNWVAGTGLEVGMFIDSLTALMLIVVTFVSTMVVIYSIGYMHDDPSKRRYYAEICLFVGSMLGLILANNFLLMFIFWELVGVCSYLLIGFWYQKPAAASAAKKAFLVTRIGDVLFLTGIAILYVKYGTLNFTELEHLMGHDVQGLLLPALLLFCGAVGKSAQFPLHVWLPNAMEGPTTVSALIHAATMVNAGIYLVARSYFILEHVPDAFLVIAVIGGITALMAATMALVQYDIKGVLAYSTISQLGYMMLALGAGVHAYGYTAGMFHLMNHAFFKALLFLAAGSVIHAVGSNDMRIMGGLHKHMKITSITMLIGSLSIAGFPFFSGFFSKDEVLASVWHAAADNNIYYLLYAMGVFTAFLTAFYIFRMWYMTFAGKQRGDYHPHESPKTMTVPLMILAVLAAGAGFIFFFGFQDFVYFGHAPHLTISHMFEMWQTWVSIAAGLSGIGLATLIYYKGTISPRTFTAGPGRRAIRRVLEMKYYMDEFYMWIAQKIIYGGSLVMDKFDGKVIDGAINGISSGGIALGHASNSFDKNAIDGTVNGLSKGSFIGGKLLWKMQSGRVQDYASLMILGVVGLVILMLLMGVV